MPLTNDLYPDRLGFVYCLTNPYVPGLVKIGATRKHPLSRTKELSAATGVPGEFALAYFQSFGDSFTAEGLTHERFAAQRANDSREFFSVHVDEVIEFLHWLPSSAAYREKVMVGEPDMVTGGTYRPPIEEVKTPWAEMFASFDDRGDGVLNAEEQAQCRALEAQLK